MYKRNLWIYCLIVVCLAVLPGLTGCKSKTPQDPRNYDIMAGPDGNLWFTDNRGNKIGEISPATGKSTLYSIPTDTSYPIGIASGPDGNLWFTEALNSSIGNISPATGAIFAYTIPTDESGPSGIIAGPDGNLWFTEYAGNKIGKISTAGTITEYDIPTVNSCPGDIVAHEPRSRKRYG